MVLEGQKTVKRAKTPNMEKYKHEQFYENTPNWYFVTTGEEIKPAKKAEINIKHVSRPETSVEYRGAAYLNNKDGNHPKELAPYSTFRQNLKASDILNAKLTNIGKGGDYDHGKNSILIYSNETIILITFLSLSLMLFVIIKGFFWISFDCFSLILNWLLIFLIAFFSILFLLFISL